MQRKNTRRNDWVWVVLTQRERAKQGKKTTFSFNGREYSDDEIRREIARKGIDTDLIFNKEMPEVPGGWTATTPTPYPDGGSWTNLHLAAKAGDIQRVILLCGSPIDVNSRCAVGMTPLDLAVNPRVRDVLLWHGGRTTRTGSYGQRVLCDMQETFDQFKDIDEGLSPFAPFLKDFSTDKVDSASISMAQMQIDRQKSRHSDSSKNTGPAADVSISPSSLMSGRAIDASSFLARRPRQVPVHEAPNGPPCPKSSKNTGGAAELSCSPISWQNTTEAPSPEKGSPYPMSRYLGSSAGSAAISIRRSSYRSFYQNPLLRQTLFLRTAMLAKGSHREQKLTKEDWEQHELWATPRLPTPQW